MSQPERAPQGPLFGVNLTLRIVCYGAIVILLSNLNAMVDSVLHPKIPYFDEEHLIVGGITALVTAVLFTLLIIYRSAFEESPEQNPGDFSADLCEL